MTREEIRSIFEINENGEFIRLIIPQMFGFPETNLIGKKKLDLTLEQVILYKKYIGMLYETLDE